MIAPLSFEEKGLLGLLRRVAASGQIDSPAVRYALIERGLVEGATGLALTPAGESLLEEFRRRSDLPAEYVVSD